MTAGKNTGFPLIQHTRRYSKNKMSCILKPLYKAIHHEKATNFIIHRLITDWSRVTTDADR